MLACRYEHDVGEVVYPSEITVQSAYALRERFRELAQDYHYKVVSLVLLDNHGGDVAGLSIVRSAMRDLQSQGVSVKTRGVGIVASAAALTLSLGSLGHRDALSGTDFVFHFSRFGGNVALTNQIARQLGKRLEIHDDNMLSILVEHCAPLTHHPGKSPSDKPVYLWPLSTVQEANLPRVDLSQRQFSDLDKCKQYMAETLRIVFESDTVIDCATAQALGLIDHVCTTLN